MKNATQRRRAGLMGAVAFLGAVAALPATSHAAKECGAFTLTIRNAAGQVVRGPIRPDTRTTLSGLPAGSVLTAAGKFVAFRVELNSLTVRDYVLTGAATARPRDRITAVRTPVFASKAPNLGGAVLTGALSVRVDEAGDGGLELKRSGGGKTMKVQAKDCSQGGIFQLEPETRLAETNTLSGARKFAYCFQAAPGGKRYFTNGDVLGYDSPEGSTTVTQGFSRTAANGIAPGFERRAVWSVMGGGRVGMVLGEDALEALRLEPARARQACPNDLLR
jgi:hypothetical protein